MERTPSIALTPNCTAVLRLLAFALAGLSLSACGASLYDDAHVARTNTWLDHFRSYPAQRTLEGKVTYYHDSLAGNHTANGEVYDPSMLTAASRTLAFGTIVRVVRKQDGRSVIVRVNDRGPFGSEERILDLSRAAATQLGMLAAGVVPVRAEILWVPD